MPTLHQISVAYRDGIRNNPSQADLLRQLRRGFREPEDEIADLNEATRYFQQTSPAQMTETLCGQALSYIRPALTTMPATGSGSVLQFRNNLRALRDDVLSPQWLKDLAQATKRTSLIREQSPGVYEYDQQAADPIVAQADAAIVVLASSTATPEEIAAASAVCDRYKALTPQQPGGLPPSP